MMGRNDADHQQISELPKVLIVDDEEAIVELLSDFVTDLGYMPYSAPNGHQALKLALEHWPVLVITDFMMPKMNGADLIKALRTEAADHNFVLPPIILLTAASVPALKDLHVDALMSKPFDLDQLEKVILRLL